MRKSFCTKRFWSAAAENISIMARQQNSKTRRLPHARHNQQLALKNVVFIHVRGGSRGWLGPKTYVTLLTLIFSNSEKSICDVRPFHRPLFCDRSVVNYTSSLLHWAKPLWDFTKYYWNRPAPLSLLAGSVPWFTPQDETSNGEMRSTRQICVRRISLGATDKLKQTRPRVGKQSWARKRQLVMRKGTSTVAAKLKPTNFRVNFLLCLPWFSWQSNGLSTGLRTDAFFHFALMSWKLNYKTFFHWICSFVTNIFVRCGIHTLLSLLEESFDKVALCVKIDPNHCCWVFYSSW